MTIKRGIDGGIYVVFHNSYDAAKWEWFWYNILRCQIASFGALENAYKVL